MRPFRRRLPERLGLRAARGIAGAAVMLTVVAASHALARDVTVAGTEMNRFGRIALRFDQPTKVNVRTANGILILSFGQPVTFKAEKLATEMPDYVSSVRRDPDRTGLRLAMTAGYRANVLEAGERVYVDLLPANWTGLPPSLPPEIVSDLARRAEAAEAKVRDETQRRRTQEPKPIRLSFAELPTLMRVIFAPPASVPVAFEAKGEQVDLTFGGTMTLDPAEAKNRLAGLVKSFSVEQGSDALKVRMLLEPGHAARGFREDDTFVVDVDTSKAEPAPTEAGRPADTAAPPGIKAHDPIAKPAASVDAKPSAGGEPKPRPATETAAPAASPPKASPSTGETPRAAAPAASAQAAEPVKTAEPAPAPQPAGPVEPTAAVTAEGLKITFPFRTREAAAAFERGGTVTVVFHSAETIAWTSLPPAATAFASLNEVVREGAFVVARLRLTKPHIIHMAPDGNAWVLSIGGTGVVPSQPLAVNRNIDDSGRAIVAVPLADSSGVHWFDGPGGEHIAVVTAFGGPHGLPKPQRFVEFHLLPSAQGLAVVADADDVVVRSGLDGVTISRGEGLSLSMPNGATAAAAGMGSALEPVIARDRWLEAQLGSTERKWRDLVHAAAQAPRSSRSAIRFDLAQFLVANGLDSEASGVLAFAAGEDPMLQRQRKFVLLQGIAAARMGRAAQAAKFLSDDVVSEDPEAVLWRAVLDAEAKRWSKALTGFRRAGAVVDLYPDDLQGTIRLLAARTGIAMREFAYADAELTALGQLQGIERLHDGIALVRALADEALGRGDVAVDAFKRLAETAERPVAAEATLHWVPLALRAGAMDMNEAIARLETLAVIWRGGDIELAAIGQLGHLYAEAGRWREAFTMARRANWLFPDADITRSLHDDTARLFEDLFLAGKGSSLSRVDAVALYFDFKEFTPIGRRGDEIVRRLADRLVELDLLHEAGDLLQHQVDNRLSGAARATVAARLAAVRLMDGKPALALAAVQSTRLAELPTAIKRARLLLEARALSDLSRTDLALEVLQGEKGPEIDRLRGDILWTGRRWREAGEAYESMVGTRWQGAEPLSNQDRSDVIRAAVADTLADDGLALDRLRTKFAPKMANSADAPIFALLGRPDAASGRAFREIARRVTSADTLAEFLTEYRKRYPEASVAERPRKKPDAGEAVPPETGPGAGASPPAEPPAPQARADAPASPKG